MSGGGSESLRCADDDLCVVLGLLRSYATQRNAIHATQRSAKHRIGISSVSTRVPTQPSNPSTQQASNQRNKKTFGRKKDQAGTVVRGAREGEKKRFISGKQKGESKKGEGEIDP